MTDNLSVGGTTFRMFSIKNVPGQEKLPFSLKILLENLLRNGGDEGIEQLSRWNGSAEPATEIAFVPARVLMQDFTGVPCVVDLAAMREAMRDIGGDPARVNPLAPAELIIDHSIIADVFNREDAFLKNAELEFQRNGERYQLLRWAQKAFSNFAVVPPNTGICHQVNLEHLGRVVFRDGDLVYPDTLVGTDSHTTMINGLGIVGWGVGGIEAEAAMLGQPVSMLIPRVVGVRFHGSLRPGVTATDLVLTVTEMLRRHNVVGKFVEFYGPGIASVSVADRATLANMSPEYGSTIAVFPVDDETIRYLRLTGRSADQIALVEAYFKEQGMWHDPNAEPAYSEKLELDLGTVVPSLAGPKRPQDRVPLHKAKGMWRTSATETYSLPIEEPVICGVPPQELPDGVEEGGVDEASAESFPASDPANPVKEREGDLPLRPSPVHGPRPRKPARVQIDGEEVEIDHGCIVIAAITSCTNTSNPFVMLGAGLLARNAVQKGLTRKPWVKTTLAPGSKVVMDYYDRAGVTEYLQKLGFYLVGYGCTTCIGNSGPLIPEVSEAVRQNDLAVAAVLSGNRNFEGRINPETKMNYLASPPLVVAYALAGTMDFDFDFEPLGNGSDGRPVYLRDIWPTDEEVRQVVSDSVRQEMFPLRYGEVLRGDERWQTMAVPEGSEYRWSGDSTYIRRPPYFDNFSATPPGATDIDAARVLVLLGDSVTTDHISPAGSIKKDSDAGKFLRAHGVEPVDFNSYGSRRGNHEVMMRGTFANIRLRNRLVPGVEGGMTRHLPDGAVMSIFTASEKYRSEGVPLLVIAGKEYGSGSSRDWAAKGTMLLGVRAVIAESYERIHRSNLVGMGVLPLQFLPGQNAESLGLTGEETFGIAGVAAADEKTGELEVRADGKTFRVKVRIDTPTEAAYFRHGGILPYVLRSLKGA